MQMPARVTANGLCGTNVDGSLRNGSGYVIAPEIYLGPGRISINGMDGASLVKVIIQPQVVLQDLLPIQIVLLPHPRPS